MSSGALILDFGGVISQTFFETHAQTERALGLPAGTLTWRGPFDPATDALWCQMQAGDISERDYWLTRSREVGALLGERWDSMQTMVKRARGDDPEQVVRPQALAAIASAQRAGIRLAILSNELDLFYGEQFRKRLSLMSAFEVIVDASHTDVLKPDPMAYEQCLAALSLSASECVFVDDQARNIAGARAIGLRAVQFNVLEPAQSFAEALALLGVFE